MVAGTYLKKMGHRRVACVTVSENVLSDFRKKGLEQVMGTVPEIVFDKELSHSLQHAMDSGMTGIFCFSDQVAKECMDCLSDCSVPERLSVVSVDDTMISTFYHLTSVAHPKELIGEYAAKALMEGTIPVKKVFPPVLMERNSVKNLRKDEL